MKKIIIVLFLFVFISNMSGQSIDEKVEYIDFKYNKFIENTVIFDTETEAISLKDSTQIKISKNNNTGYIFINAEYDPYQENKPPEIYGYYSKNNLFLLKTVSYDFYNGSKEEIFLYIENNKLIYQILKNDNENLLLIDIYTTEILLPAINSLNNAYKYYSNQPKIKLQ